MNKSIPIIFILLLNIFGAEFEDDLNNSKIIKSYFQNGKIESIYPLKNKKMHGIVKTYYDNGNLRSEVDYKDGINDGIWRTYHENGKLETERMYANGEVVGVSKSYYETGTLRSEAFNVNGKTEGLVRMYFETGILHFERNYKNDRQEGLSKEYYKDGTLKSEAYYQDGFLHGLTKSYYPNGKIQRENIYEYNQLISAFEYTLDGQKSKVEFKIAIKPSFDCSKINTNIERLICINSELSTLDNHMSKSFFALKKTLEGDALNRLQNTQKSWLSSRQRACSSIMHKEECLEQLYKERIAFLDLKLNNNLPNLLMRYNIYRMDDYAPQWINNKLIFSGFNKDGNNFDVFELDPISGNEKILAEDIRGAKFIAQNDKYLIISEKGQMANPLIVFDKKSKKKVKQIKLESQINWGCIIDDQLVIVQSNGGKYNPSGNVLFLNLPNLEIVNTKGIVSSENIKILKNNIIAIGNYIGIYDKNFNEIAKSENIPTQSTINNRQHCSSGSIEISGTKAVAITTCGDIRIYDYPSLTLKKTIPSFSNFATLAITNGLIFVAPNDNRENYDDTRVFELDSGKYLATLPIRGSNIYAVDNKIITVKQKFANISEINIYEYDMKSLKQEHNQE